PCLYLVMLISTLFAYFWMMPDEFKNFGQSVFATTLFSNNVLLALTSGYWALASEYKPLLHTWSLGVEEQYYIVFPFVLIIGWKYFRRYLGATVFIIATISLLLATWGVAKSPDLAFYLLPTRAWEILLGSLTAFYLSNKTSLSNDPVQSNFLSFVGLLLIVVAIFTFGINQPSPGLFTLVPVIGTALIIVYASEQTFAGKLLGNKFAVGFGLISYSSYLWHQPLFSFSRIYLVNTPSSSMTALLTVTTFFIAYLSWKFVEIPFRDKSLFSRNAIFLGAVLCSAAFLIGGLYLNKSYGMPLRVFPDNVSIQDLDKRIYNERVFDYKKDRFSDLSKINVLVTGNSTGRDFVNMTSETFDMSNVEIVYQDEFGDCILPFKNNIYKKLVQDADIVVFASNYKEGCIKENIEYSKKNGFNLFYSGPKAFGHNLNWIIRLPPAEQANQFNPLPAETIESEQKLLAQVPAENYLSLMSRVVKHGEIPITDERGLPISTDRVHLTKYGAVYFGKKALLTSRYGELLKNACCMTRTD
ncbi:MAG: hypothetical protein JWP79_3317, partial [Polaromonas sp.]|nr:hypothetical protein [Polaromonas sp.]